MQRLETKWAEIQRYSYNDRRSDYQSFHHELRTAIDSGLYQGDDERRLRAMLDEVKTCMKPKLGFLGGSANGRQRGANMPGR